MPPAALGPPAKSGEQVLAEAKAKEEAKARNVWLHAWHDPVAGLKAYSPCVRLADISADGESKLLVAGSDCKLKIYKGTTLVSENVLLDAPVSICVFYPDAKAPRIPSVAVAAGPFVFIYRNLRPYYRFSLPMLEVDAKESELWSDLGEGRLSVDEAKQRLAALRDSGVGLTSRSQDLLGLDDPAAVHGFVAEHQGVPLAQQTACTCMEALKRDAEEDDAVSLPRPRPAPRPRPFPRPRPRPRPPPSPSPSPSPPPFTLHPSPVPPRPSR
jgi:Bardet-Biedl syndrome 1 protein